jgi:hypothetical protein
MSAFAVAVGGKADMACAVRMSASDPKRTSRCGISISIDSQSQRAHKQIDDERSVCQIIGRNCGLWLVCLAQTLKTEPDANQLACGQKVLVENNTCPADQILDVTGSCLKTAPVFDVAQTPRGTQYNCVKRGGSNPRVIR